MIVPSIGRVVLVHLGSGHLGDQPAPGLVTYVHHERSINVGGFRADGSPFALTPVPLLQDDDELPKHGAFAYWMPYQKDQAAKTEAKQLAPASVAQLAKSPSASVPS